MSQPEFENSTPAVPTREQRVHARQRRQTLTFLGMFGFIMLIGLVALGNWQQWWTIGGTGEPAASCSTSSQAVSAPAQTSVDVYNSTNRSGLAAAVAGELVTRGFKVLATGNKSESKPITDVVMIRYGSAGKVAAHTVALQFPAKVELVKDKRKSKTVDVLIGSGYKAMIGRTKAAEAIAPGSKSGPCAARRRNASGSAPAD